MQREQQVIEIGIKVNSLVDYLKHCGIEKQFESLKGYIVKQHKSIHQLLYFTVKQVSEYYQNQLFRQRKLYEEEIYDMKDEISRQYKVIGLMKQEVEDLMVMLNQQQQHYHKQTQQFISAQTEGKNRQSSSSEYSQQQPQQNFHSSSNLPVQQPKNNQFETHKSNLLAGLEVIIEEGQTQRTLMSIQDEEESPKKFNSSQKMLESSFKSKHSENHIRIQDVDEEDAEAEAQEQSDFKTSENNLQNSHRIVTAGLEKQQYQEDKEIAGIDSSSKSIEQPKDQMNESRHLMNQSIDNFSTIAKGDQDNSAFDSQGLDGWKGEKAVFQYEGSDEEQGDPEQPANSYNGMNSKNIKGDSFQKRHPRELIVFREQIKDQQNSNQALIHATVNSSNDLDSHFINNHENQLRISEESEVHSQKNNNKAEVQDYQNDNFQSNSMELNSMKSCSDFIDSDTFRQHNTEPQQSNHYPQISQSSQYSSLPQSVHQHCYSLGSFAEHSNDQQENIRSQNSGEDQDSLSDAPYFINSSSQMMVNQNRKTESPQIVAECYDGKEKFFKKKQRNFTILERQKRQSVEIGSGCFAKKGKENKNPHFYGCDQIACSESVPLKTKPGNQKTKHFLEEFRKTFNKCLNTIQNQKKYSSSGRCLSRSKSKSQRSKDKIPKKQSVVTQGKHGEKEQRYSGSHQKSRKRQSNNASQNAALESYCLNYNTHQQGSEKVTNHHMFYEGSIIEPTNCEKSNGYRYQHREETESSMEGESNCESGFKPNRKTSYHTTFDRSTTSGLKRNRKSAQMPSQIEAHKNRSFGVGNPKQSSSTSRKSSANVGLKTKNESNAALDSMMNELGSQNKFLVGNRKIELKYEGDRDKQNSQQRSGHGILHYSNGLCYEGEFRNNLRCGYGVLKFNHIQLYSGDWLNDELTGQGKIRNCAIINKKKSTGSSSSSFGNSTQCQSSSISPLNKWISYCGYFKNSKFQGEGTLHLQGGEKFIGRFCNGTANGEGSLFKKNGEIQLGLWKNNVLIERFQDWS